jgi:transcriptional regulator with XRE-family HTH domain
MPAKRLAKSVATQFGIELRKARGEAELTQQVLAERAEIDPVFVSLLENGHRQPSLTVLLNLERVLNLAAGELVQRVSQALRGEADAPTAKRGARRR